MMNIKDMPWTPSYDLVERNFKKLLQSVDALHKFASQRFSIGARVWVKHVDEASYYYAHIIATHEGNLYDVQYNDNDIEENVSRYRVTVSIEECCGCNMILRWVRFMARNEIPARLTTGLRRRKESLDCL